MTSERFSNVVNIAFNIEVYYVNLLKVEKCILVYWSIRKQTLCT